MEKQWKCYTKAFRDTWIRTLRSDTNLQISDGTIPGLFLRYSAAIRHIRFYLGCKIKDKKRNILLGQYGDFTIRDIRDRAWALRHEIALGHDPIQDKKAQAAQQEKDRGELFCNLFPQYMDKYARIYKKPKTQIANHAQYRLYIGPIFGKMHMREIEERHIMDAYAKWAKKTSFATANKALSLVYSFWAWCELYKYVDRNTNPCKYVARAGIKHTNHKSWIRTAIAHYRMRWTSDRASLICIRACLTRYAC